MGLDDLPRIEIESRGEWRWWLERNHASAAGVWVVTFKKAAGDRYVSWGDLVAEALAFGWIDSLRRPVDEHRSQQLVTPRKPKSGWSRVNKQRVEELEAQGLMTEAGRAAIERAKSNGSWSALDEVEMLIEPDDLGGALDSDPAARRHWDEFPRSAKRAILEWVGSAKRPETRERRVSETARLAAEGIRANQPRQPKGR